MSWFVMPAEPPVDFRFKDPRIFLTNNDRPELATNLTFEAASSLK